MMKAEYSREGPLHPAALGADDLPQGAKCLAKKGLRDGMDKSGTGTIALFNMEITSQLIE